MAQATRPSIAAATLPALGKGWIRRTKRFPHKGQKETGGSVEAEDCTEERRNGDESEQPQHQAVGKGGHERAWKGCLSVGGRGLQGGGRQVGGTVKARPSKVI